MMLGNFHWLDLTEYAVTLLPADYWRSDTKLFHNIPVLTSNFKDFLNVSYYFKSRNLPSLY